jgi:UDP-N-acetylglucosamine diphosphorylase/glucosamine-1-phosphate N-acetyltransferase
MSNLSVIILAGGLGKRMQSEIPKVLHCLHEKPMLVHVLESALQLAPKMIYIVVGKYEPIIRETLSQYLDIDGLYFVNQPEALGTGHAIQCARPYLLGQPTNDQVVILSGDVPLLQSSTIKSMMEENAPVTLMTSTVEMPKGYGRIVCDEDGNFEKIVEEKDCSDAQREIQVINAGIYAFHIGLLCDYLPMITNENAQEEYYLTDIFEIIRQKECMKMAMYHLPKEQNLEITGINTKEQLEALSYKGNLGSL